MLFLAALLVLFADSKLDAREFQFDYQKIVETDGDAELILTYCDGNLEVVSTDGDRIIIEAIKKVKAVSMDEAEEVADHIEIKVQKDDNQVKVTTNYLQMRNRSSSFWKKVLGLGGSDSFGAVDWVIHVPENCKLQVNCTSGRISIGHIIGDIKLHCPNGRISIGHIIGDIKLRSSSSQIELASIEGRIDVENSSGSTVGELLFGPVTVRQAMGKIDLKWVEGDIRIRSLSADIAVRQERGSIDLTTSTGNVDIQTNLNSARDYFVETESGHIRLSIPETSSGNLRIETQAGDISTDIPIAIKSMSRKQVEGKFGFGGVTINLSSISGDVTVAQF